VEGLIWASILAAVVKRYITHAAALATRSDLSTQRAAASAFQYLPDIINALAQSCRAALLAAIRDALAFLMQKARRAHPDRDRTRGRLQAGLRPVASRFSVAMRLVPTYEGLL